MLSSCLAASCVKKNQIHNTSLAVAVRHFILAVTARLAGAVKLKWVRCQACKFAALLAETSDLNFLSYAPVLVECPEDQQSIRPVPNGLPQAEANWVHGRKKVAILVPLEP